MKRLQLKDKGLQHMLDDQGYAIIGALPEEIVVSLLDTFQKLHPNSPKGFYSTTHSEDLDFRRTNSDRIINIIAEILKNKFDNIDILGAAFIAKSPDNNSVLPLHQDWNIVDEKLARSYNIWIPLVNVDTNNGAMVVLPESHNKEMSFRGAGINNVYSAFEKDVLDNFTSLDMASGEILTYDHALLHASPINKSNNIRLAVVLGVVPKDVELRNYQKIDGRIVEFESHRDYFFENDPSSVPENLKKLGEVDWDDSQRDLSTFKRVYMPQVAKKKSFIEKLKFWS